MLTLLRTTLCSLAAQAHRLAGRLWFKAGNLERARDHFERVLELKGDDFVAYIYLGRLAYSLGDYAGWRREYEHARRTAPERYARIRNPFDLFEARSAGTLREETGERATWRTVKIQQGSGFKGLAGMTGMTGMSGMSGLTGMAGMAGSGNAFLNEGLRARLSANGAFPPRGRHAKRFGDDFASAEERSRFRELPPIQRNELGHVDLERLLDELSR